MLKLAIFANQLLILALEFPLVSHARTAGAMSRFPDAGGLGVIGAWRGGELMRTTLIGEIAFMSGLAAGRLLSLFLDGWPSPILIAYAVAELLLAGWGTYCGLRSLAMPILVALENLGDIPIGCLLCRAEARTIASRWRSGAALDPLSGAMGSV
jgi:hypothetical protein